jgi:hypothetical protein
MLRSRAVHHARLVSLAALLLVLGCGRAIDRPAHGAAPGTEAPDATSGVPPTLQPSEALRFRALPTPSPGLVVSPVAAASPVGSPSPAAAPPIVRTIAPAPNASSPAGAPTTISAVLVGRGADLASASLALNGADAGATVDKRSPRDWSIHTTQNLGPGAYTARVLVHDASGGNGGFTWQFSIGQPEPEEAPEPTATHAPTPNRAPAKPVASPDTSPRTP